MTRPIEDRAPAEPVDWHRAERWAIGGAVLFVAVTIVAGATLGGGGALERIAALPWTVAPALLGLSLVNYALRGLRWELFSRGVGLRVPTAWNALYYVAGFAMAPTPGKLGEAVRLWLLRRRHGLAYERTAALMLGDRLSDALAVMLLAFLALALLLLDPGSAGSMPSSAALEERAIAMAGSAVVVLAATGLLLSPARSGPALAFAYRMIGRAPRLFGRVRRALRQTGRLGAPGIVLGGLVLGLAGWAAESYALLLLLRAMGAEVGFAAAAAAFCIAMLVGAVAMLPGGLGGTEVTMVALLVAFGVDLPVAVAATAAIRATTLWFAVALGFIALPLALRGLPADPATRPTG